MKRNPLQAAFASSDVTLNHSVRAYHRAITCDGHLRPLPTFAAPTSLACALVAHFVTDLTKVCACKLVRATELPFLERLQTMAAPSRLEMRAGSAGMVSKVVVGSLLYRARAPDARRRLMPAEHHLQHHKLEAIEPRTIAIIARSFGVVVA
jgi:hypothetical protein